MTIVLLTSASTSPWSRPSDWADTGHTVELVGAGGQSGAASTGVSGRGGGGGGGGGYGKFTWTSGALAATTIFAVKTNNTTASQTTNATIWTATATTTAYWVGPGQPGSTATAGVGGSAGAKSGSPSPNYGTAGGNAGGNGGGASTTQLAGGAGGGGAGGPLNTGSTGGATTGATGGGVGGAGGGAANNGVTGNGVAVTSSVQGGNGGNGVGPSGTLGGAGSTITTGSGNGSAGLGGKGGGGGCGYSGTTTSQFLSGYAGGPNGNVTDWVGFLVTGTTQAGTTSNVGGGAGGGGGGGSSGNVTITSAGGAGGSYGGGGGGPGATRGTNSGGVGQGASGLIAITYTPAGGTLYQGTAFPAGAGSLTANLTLVPAGGTGAGTSQTFSNNVLHYTFDSDSLPAVTDTSGNSNTGTLGGTGTTVGAGQVGANALTFNGSGTIALTDVSLLGLPTSTSEISGSCWIKTTGNNIAISSLRDGPGNGLINFTIGWNGVANNATTLPSIIFRDSGGLGLTYVISSVSVGDNNWHHVAFTRNSSKLITLYVDGVSVGSATDTMTGALTPVLANSSIVSTIPGVVPALVGSIDDFQYYSRALTSTEISTMYVAGITPPAPPVQFMYTKRRFIFLTR